MKTTVSAIIVLFLALGIGSHCLAYETDFTDIQEFDRSLPFWKFGRGVTNILSGPHELLTHMTNNAIKGAYKGAYDGGLQGYVAGGTNGFIAGIVPGLVYGFRRMTTGALEILTFWKPEYGPTMDPEYGTRNLAFGTQDYFQSEPFWYDKPQ